MSRQSSSPQSIRNASDQSLFDGDDVDPLILYADQQQQQLAADAIDLDELIESIERRRVSNVLADYTVAPAGVGTGGAAASTSQPAGVGVASSPRPRATSTPRPSSRASSASTPPSSPRAVPGTTRRLIMHRIVNAPISRAEEIRLRQRFNITDQDLDDYVASLPAAGTLAAAAPAGFPSVTTALIPFVAWTRSRSGSRSRSRSIRSRQPSRSRRHAASIGFVGGRCPSTGPQSTHSQHHAHQHRHHRVRRQRGTAHGASHLQSCQ